MKRRGITIPELIMFMAIFLTLLFTGIKRTKDVRESSKGAKVQQDLVTLRMSLEEFYQKTGEYPKLVGGEVEENLSTVVVIGKDGEEVNFAKILGQTKMPSTPKIDTQEASNVVNNIQNFSEGTGRGGWNYNELDGTGEIHVNLPKDAFNQGIDWSRE